MSSYTKKFKLEDNEVGIVTGNMLIGWNELAYWNAVILNTFFLCVYVVLN